MAKKKISRKKNVAIDTIPLPERSVSIEIPVQLIIPITCTNNGTIKKRRNIFKNITRFDKRIIYNFLIT